MTAKEYLKQAFHIDRRIKDKLERISSMHDLATKATSVITGMPGSATHDPHSMQEVIAKIIDDEKVVSADIDKLVDLKRDISHTIEQVSDENEKMLLEQRYLNFKSWERLAEDMNFSLRWVHIMHGRALKSVEKILSERVHMNSL